MSIAIDMCMFMSMSIPMSMPKQTPVQLPFPSFSFLAALQKDRPQTKPPFVPFRSCAVFTHQCKKKIMTDASQLLGGPLPGPSHRSNKETCTRPRPRPRQCPRLMPTRSCYQRTESIGGSQHLRSQSESERDYVPNMRDGHDDFTAYHPTQLNTTQHINKKDLHRTVISSQGPLLCLLTNYALTHTNNTRIPRPTSNISHILFSIHL